MRQGRRLAWRMTIWTGAALGCALLLGASAPAATPEGKSKSAAAEQGVAGIVEGKPVYVEELANREIQEARSKLFDMESARLREIALARLRASRPEEFPVPDTSVADEEVKKLYDDAKLSARGTLEKLTPQIRAYLKQQKQEATDREHYQLAIRKGYVKPLLIPPTEFEVELAAVERPTSRGPADAPVEIVEFSDFQCPFCFRANPTVVQMLKKYEGKIHFTYRHLPLTRIHPRAQELAEASECAAEQGRFWPFHDLLFENFSEVQTVDLGDLAKQAGVRDGKRFDACREARIFRKRVAEDIAAAEALQIGGTPTFLVGRRTGTGTIKGVLMEGAQPLPEFDRAIAKVLEKNEK